MYYEWFCFTQNWNIREIVYWDDEDVLLFPNSNLKVLFYIWINDKNWKKIYEGDILIIPVLRAMYSDYNIPSKDTNKAFYVKAVVKNIRWELEYNKNELEKLAQPMKKEKRKRKIYAISSLFDKEYEHLHPDLSNDIQNDIKIIWNIYENWELFQ